MKIKFAYECDKWVSHHPGHEIGQTEITLLEHEPFKMAPTPNDEDYRFKIYGIWPIGSDIFSEEYFSETFVTDVITAPNTLVLEKSM